MRTLEDKVSIPRSITRVAQSSETKRMSSVVSQANRFLDDPAKFIKQW